MAISEIVDGYMLNETDSAFYYAQLEYEFALNVDNKKYMAIASLAQGYTFLKKSNHEKALEYFEKTLKISK